MTGEWHGQNANNETLVEYTAKAIKKIGSCFQARCANSDLSTIEGIEKAVDNLVAYKYLVDGEVEFLKRYLVHCLAERDAPKRAQARDDCDKILMKLDSIRDIICRSIEGDADVVCTETGAETISRWLESMIEKLPHLAETAYVVEGKR